jgi:hypothetical protein
VLLLAVLLWLMIVLRVLLLVLMMGGPASRSSMRHGMRWAMLLLVPARVLVLLQRMLRVVWAMGLGMSIVLLPGLR